MPDYVAVLRPRMFVIENVPDLIRHRDGKTLADVLERFERPAKRLRYHVEYKVYDAALFGTPQARRRILILGVRHGGKERLPEPGPDLAPLFAAVRHEGAIPKDCVAYLKALRDPENATLISASQALSDLPLLGPGELEAERPYASEPKTAFQRWARIGAPKKLRDTRTPAVNAETVKRLEHIPPGGCARVIPEEHLNGLSRRYDSAYRRLHPDAPSTALSTKYDCVYHYEKQRSLSVRKYARLQEIPDCVTFPSAVVCRRSAYEMIGNSVPPLLIERVLGEVLNRGNRGGERMRTASPLRRGAANRLAHIDAVLEAAYGTPEADLGNKPDPLDEAIYIILSFQTDLARATSTWSQLRATFPTWDAVARAPAYAVARALREGGLHRQKTRTIRSLLAEVRRTAGQLSLDHLRPSGTY